MQNTDLIKAFVDKGRVSDGNRHSCRNMFYIGKVLYSYGIHFPLVILNGNMAYVNDGHTTPTTKRQRSLARMMLRQAGWNVEDVDSYTAERMERYARNLARSRPMEYQGLNTDAEFMRRHG